MHLATTSWVLLPFATVLGGAHAYFDGTQKFESRLYDLTSINYDLYVMDSKDTPPSTTETTWYFSTSGPLSSDNEDCPKGSQVCGVQRVRLGDKETVTEVIPVAGEFESFKSGIQTREIGNGGGLVVTFTGGKWGDSQDMSAELTFKCNKSVAGVVEPKLISWDGKRVSLELTHVLVCPTGGESPDNGKGDDNKDGDKGRNGDGGKDQYEDTESGFTLWSLIKWMFIIAIILVALVFLVRALTDYQRYGLTGLDLLPQSDTIRDIPYLVRDFFRKIANTFAGGPSRGGYSAV